ncbi:MAG: hypothetical protein WC647_04030 [Desulfomonilaceae bacterium]|jgi:hypothetical protein
MNQTTEARQVFTEETVTDPQMDAIVERLYKERDEAYEGYLKNGRKWGVAWAKQAQYVALKLAVQNDYYLNNDTVFFDEYDETWSDWVPNIFEADPLLGRGEGNYFNPLTQAWIDGWFAGISDFWDQVSSKL